MKILLDTHIFLWFVSSDRRLTPDMRDIIQNLDRMLICQALQNDMAIATVDETVRSYPVKLI